MKKIQLILVIFILTFSGVFAQSSGEPRYIKPTNFQKKVTTNIADKSRSYYSLNTDQASTISVKGPGILCIRSRGRFVPDEDEKISYNILYAINGGEKENFELESVLRSKKATYKNGALGVPGQLMDNEIELGRGNHTVSFYLGNENMPVAARYRFTPIKPKKQDWIAFSPAQPSEPVELISRESSVKYYRFSNEKPLKVAINGPTELRVLTRIENHYDMKGRILYRLQVREGDEIISTYQMSSRRSEIAMYKEDRSLIPGKACEFVIDVPKGRHYYEVLPLDKDKNTVLGRCLLPEKDVSLEH